MNQLQDDKEEVEVFVHGKLAKIKVDPLMSLLYKLRPRLIDEKPKDRVAKVEATYKTLTELIAKRVVAGRIDEIGELAKEGKRVGGFHTIPNLQNHLKLRLAQLTEQLSSTTPKGKDV